MGTHYYALCGRYAESLPIQGTPDFSNAVLEPASSIHGDFFQWQQVNLSAGDQDDGQYAFNVHARGDAVLYHKSGQGYHKGGPTWTNQRNAFWGNICLVDNRAFRHSTGQNHTIVGCILMGQIGSATVDATGSGVDMPGMGGSRLAHCIVDFLTASADNFDDNVHRMPFTDAYTIPPLQVDIDKLTARFRNPILSGEEVIFAPERAATVAEHKAIWERYLAASGSPALSVANGGTMAHDTGLERCDYDAGTYTDP